MLRLLGIGTVSNFVDSRSEAKEVMGMQTHQLLMTDYQRVYSSPDRGFRGFPVPRVHSWEPKSQGHHCVPVIPALCPVSLTWNCYSVILCVSPDLSTCQDVLKA